MTRGSIGKAFAACTAPALLAGVAAGADWPQWRGPGRDGVASGFEAPTTGKQLWRHPWNESEAIVLAPSHFWYAF